MEHIITESDFDDVIKLIGIADLEKFFLELGLRPTDIEKEKANAGVNDINLQARNVLRFWSKTEGKAASRERILEALEKCENRLAVQQLEATWKLEGMCNILRFWGPKGKKDTPGLFANPVSWVLLVLIEKK